MVRGGTNDDASQSILHKSVPTNNHHHEPFFVPGPQHDQGILPTWHDNGFPMAHPAPNKNRIQNKKVACLKMVSFWEILPDVLNDPALRSHDACILCFFFLLVHILPAGQMHGLDPAAQPRSWLDIVASANTTEKEKNEAMEEILILGKDKQGARILLDEGILDYIIWTLSSFFEKVNANKKETDWANPEIRPNSNLATKVAATCCVTLGKSHSSAIHTKGKLQLMSLYERGTVPKE
jgi:hypothetical protein